jgi:hypothetical protein
VIFVQRFVVTFGLIFLRKRGLDLSRRAKGVLFLHDGVFLFSQPSPQNKEKSPFAKHVLKPFGVGGRFAVRWAVARNR